MTPTAHQAARAFREEYFVKARDLDECLEAYWKYRLRALLDDAGVRDKVAYEIAKHDCRNEQDHVVAAAKFALNTGRYGKLAQAAIDAIKAGVKV